MYEIAKKKYWRCHICNDIHFGDIPPELCPTCSVKDAYVETDLKESLILLKGETNE